LTVIKELLEFDMRVLMTMLAIGLFALVVSAQESPSILPGTKLLTADQPLDILMVDGIDRFCLAEIAKAREARESKWNRDYSSFEAYDKSLAPYRDRFRTNIGAVDKRVDAVQFETPLTIGDRDLHTFHTRWPVLPGLSAEGIVLAPPGHNAWKRVVIVVPDSRWTPQEFAIGTGSGQKAISPLPQLLVQNGCLVVIPTLISRDDDFAGNPEIAMTNQSNREWVYRSAFEMGRHVIGYEVQKILATVDLVSAIKGADGASRPVSVVGVGDGGQIAMYSAALDTRLSSVLVSGYFQPREGVWQEPIDRNVWRQLTEFGDAEIAAMIAPRPLIIEACAVPETDGPLPVKAGRRGGAAPGQIKTADLSAVKSEFERAKAIYEKLKVGNHIQLVTSGVDGRGNSTSHDAIKAFAEKAGWKDFQLKPTTPGLADWSIPAPDPKVVQRRQVEEAVEFTQKTLRNSYRVRDKLFSQADRSSVDKWVASAEKLREHVYNELIGKLADPTMPPNPRTRKILDEKEYTGYEVVLDTYPDVIAAGILLLPKGMKPDEKRPVVVCQHGLEGVPMDTISGPPVDGYKYYKSFTAELAKRGFITYAPQNPYRGQDRFRTLQRKSNPLGRSLFSYIIPQHLVTLKWLSTLPNVDDSRLAFYGLSYGGKTAMRVPPMLPPRDGVPGYCLSICSADFNEWVAKNASVDLPFTYVFTPEYEIFEWNMGHLANYAELAMLMTPRPFMVERGHDDGVGIDEWVAFEFAKVRRHYSKLGLGDQTEIEFFNGPHTINGQATFEFLHRHLKWPRK
jgi:cephalosporin-C deacetylase-like acetyl esterase